MKRKGILLAISSLPGKSGIGDFSLEAYDFIRLLRKNNFTYWQILPLNPLGFASSPYQPFSSFAIDEIYISLPYLKDRELIKHIDLVEASNTTNYNLARQIKEKAIEESFNNYLTRFGNRRIKEFLSKHKEIEEYCDFISLKEMNNDACWNNWTIDKENDLDRYNHLFYKHAFAQMILETQWLAIKSFANKNGVSIIGDVPFYVGYDSSDVYFNKESFLLDWNNNYAPIKIAGVPPDYFSKTGQRWGNPIYNWNFLYCSNFDFLIRRLACASKLYDEVRIDHFRAFDSYWAIEPNCETAIDGHWEYPDGYGFFDTLYSKYPDIKILAEDLGLLREEVYSLKDHYNLKGMRILQFSFDDDEFYNKRNEKENQIYYTGTHDNETLLQWITAKPIRYKNKINKLFASLNIEGKSFNEKFIKYALNRKEEIVIIPIQDILELNKKFRMNIPGEVNSTNWSFKLKNFNEVKTKLKIYREY